MFVKLFSRLCRKLSVFDPVRIRVCRSNSETPCISFKFILKVSVEEAIVNALLVSLQSKNTNNAKRLDLNS
jgi:hypothetical protein